MNNLVIWLIPPVVGAVIGYVTNAVAIKMLFRPLNEIRLFRFRKKNGEKTPGFRLPFTPGILPRQRHKLADSIGSMVERELLTPEILRERLRREDVRAAIEGAISRYIETILTVPIGSLSLDKQNLPPVITQVLRDFLSSPAFDAILNQFLETIIESLEQVPPEQEPGKVDSNAVEAGATDSIVPVGNTVARRGLLDRSVRDLIGDDGTTKLQKKIEGLIQEGLNGQNNLKKLIRPVMEKAFPQIAVSLVYFLSKPET
ncbi:hypothetical protein FACS189493_7280 [Spirochaetia bacterium]|nr:hypothetical protein FACS189493_7280 [Spirochaetia bacterium]